MAVDVKLAPQWKTLLQDEFGKDYFQSLVDFVKAEYASGQVFPAGRDIFAAFAACAPADVKVVILGQDPYHGIGQAHGLAFSVRPGVDVPPSLLNIYKEIESDLGVKKDFSAGDLHSWAEQGVLLLNATLTVRAHQAGSHQKKGWEEFTDAVIRALADNYDQLVFILWGSYAQHKGEFLDDSKHLVIKSPHPSPLSAHRGFLGSKPFSRTNAYLVEQGKTPINW